MKLSQIKRRVISIFMTVAVVFGALAPSISQTFASQVGEKHLTMVICSADAKQVSVNVDLGGTTDQVSKDHCPFCTLHAPTLLSEVTELRFQLTGKTFFPELFYQSPKPLFAWLYLPSRAPPHSV